MANDEVKMDSSILFEDFKQHIDIENNSRILFSGKFGIGKTTYLKEFFESFNNEYEVFHLYPINYQISSNEDIMELIKYDILIDLITSNKNIFNNDNNNDVSLIAYIKDKMTVKSSLKFAINNILEPVTSILGNGGIGNILGRSLNDMLEFDKEFQKFKKGNEGSIDEFLKENNDESDLIGQIIKAKILEISNIKKSVLIIDDLDRMDPEHIFRILNIFSAHFDNKDSETSNKFGFDKVILVADYNNLMSIFHHKYGKETDASGYFDKYFSNSVYSFDNRTLIEKNIGKIVSNYRVIEKEILEKAWVKHMLVNVLVESLFISRLNRGNLRNLFKNSDYNLSKSVKLNNNLDDKDSFIHIFNQLLDVLINIFGGAYEHFLVILKEIKGNVRNDYVNTYLYKSIMENILPEMNGYVDRENIYNCGWNNYNIQFSETTKRISVLNTINNSRNVNEWFYNVLIEYIKEKNTY